jgi:hypothetical protein
MLVFFSKNEQRALQKAFLCLIHVRKAGVFRVAWDASAWLHED